MRLNDKNLPFFFRLEFIQKVKVRNVFEKELEIKAQEELLVRQNNDQERLNREEEAERKTAEFRIKFGNYWYCRDVDTWVDLETRSIPHFDQVNRLCIMNLDCNQTEQSCITTLLYLFSKWISFVDFSQFFLSFLKSVLRILLASFLKDCLIVFGRFLGEGLSCQP